MWACLQEEIAAEFGDLEESQRVREFLALDEAFERARESVRQAPSQTTFGRRQRYLRLKADTEGYERHKEQSREYQRKRRAECARPKSVNVCAWCGQQFVGTTSRPSKFCSPSHRQMAWLKERQ